MIGKLSGGLSPAALATAYLDWSLHLIASPDKQTELIWALLSDPAGEDAALDPRFKDATWQAQPYATFAQQFLAAQQWWDQATRGLPGVDPKHERMVNFMARQWLDMMSPANFAATNPLVVARSIAEGGENLRRGLRYWLEDFHRLISGRPRRASTFAVGTDLATTPGDVVLKNDLIELIRYHPTTDKLHPEPILIVPAWIMKYYILDLTAERSLVAYLRDQGFEVFIISWKNPGASDAHLSMQTYLDLGPRAALTHLKHGGAERVHAVGYCLGGTLLSIAAAAAARDQDSTLLDG
ncbi:hypothetical protein So717_35970 [Roseobacter cerasinus]|uniref:Poly-beta-hydroxybutyrate polymerase n=2 Tax=Roseobacter cerasinus TaxID=2602289 RepID=A0A640VW61_9RHOB|nr:hypothetical protein So717_35970 [Roseobacter cerasinus]